MGSETYSYDPNLPLTTSVQKVVSSTTYTTTYTYNLAGELTSITYPSSRLVQQTYDAIGRLCEIAPQTTGCGTATSPFATGYGYNTAFQLTGFNYGNGVSASLGYSADRLQLTSLSYAKGTTTLLSLAYGYAQNSGNDGEITSITDSVDSGRTANYTYDALGRLSTAVTNGSTNYPQWGLSWTYDRYGNRSAQNVTAGTAPSNSVTIDATTNRITGTGYGYDANGNMTQDGTNTLSYDAENHLLTTTGGSASGTYTYDGNGLRVQKVPGSTTTVYIFSGSKVIAEYVNGAAPASPTREYIYSGSQLLAKVEGGVTNYYHADHLSARVTTDSSGNKAGEQGHYPFGESWYSANTTTKFQFTTYERDPESGNDYAMARFDVNRLGRFASPDPFSGNALDPQTLNRYAYARNDPLNLIDPAGLTWFPGTNFWSLITTVTATITVNGEAGDLEGGFAPANVGPKGDQHEGADGKTPLDQRNQERFKKAQKKAPNGLDNPDCQSFLKAQGIDPADVQAAIENQVPWDGTKSTISQYDAGVLDPQDSAWKTERGISFAKATPVSRDFVTSAGGPIVMAESQALGNNSYYRPGNFFNAGGLTPGNVFHEALHQATRMGDPALAQKLGLPAGAGSADINPVLAAHHCI